MNSSSDEEKDEISAQRSSMNPLAPTFTPTFPKPTLSDCAVSDHSGDVRHSSSGHFDSVARESLMTGLGISSTTTFSPVQQQEEQTGLGTTTLSSISLGQQERSTPSDSSPLTATSATMTAITTTTTTNADFDPEEFRISLMRQISDKLETGLDRHFSQLVTATTSLPLSPTVLEHSGYNAAGISAEEATILQLKKMLRSTNTELDRLKDKNQQLRETNHKLELQHLEATHQVARLQDFEMNNQFLLSRIKELESSSNSSQDSGLEAAHTSGYRQNLTLQNQQMQQLLREVAALTSERDALKIRSWELEKKPYAQQQQQEMRSAHFIDLENERNRLIDELSQKTVAMEDLWNKNEVLMLRAKEYEKRVWELEGQVAALEADCASLPRIQLELSEMEARANAADALVEKLQDMEGQVALVKTLQERIHELETTNAELDHSNWDLSEKLNIANNQHALLTKEFESFRSKDKDDRRLEYLAARNRELEALLAEQVKTSPDYKEEYERLSSEMEKLKVKMPQLEGQAKQVALLRSKTLQLEKQIKTMEDLEPRLESMQQLHERNMFLESELGELEHLRAREMELEQTLEESKARLIQLEASKTRMNSFSGLRQLQTRARSGSVAHQGPIPPMQHLSGLQAPQPQSAKETGAENDGGNLKIKIAGTSPSRLARSSLSISSMDAILSPRSPKLEFAPATVMSGGVPTPTTATWPSGRSSMSMANSSHRMSTSSSTSTIVSSGSNSGPQQKPFQQGYSTPLSPEESEEEQDEGKKEATLPKTMTEEPESFVPAPLLQGAV
ncbi:hypothetical protein EDD11_005540 [Mortierella claussenii]|nr:hypothetical protein EDD11_005540 [Mortierella claussenii]